MGAQLGVLWVYLWAFSSPEEMISKNSFQETMTTTQCKMENNDTHQAGQSFDAQKGPRVSRTGSLVKVQFDNVKIERGDEEYENMLDQEHKFWLKALAP